MPWIFAPLRLILPGLNGAFWFLLKVSFYIYVFMWLRFTLPRYRFDQLMHLGWYLLIPLAIVNVFSVGMAMLLESEFGWNRWLALVVTMLFTLVRRRVFVAPERQTNGGRFFGRCRKPRTPMLDSIMFYFFAGVAMLSAALMVTRRNAIHCAVFLITTLLATAGIFLQLRAEFLFIAQIILYVGGIMVLFVFVIMLVRLDVPFHHVTFRFQKWVAFVAIALACEVGAVLYVRRLPGQAY